MIYLYEKKIMKKVLRLTESDLVKLIQKVVSEQYNSMYTTSETGRYKYSRLNPLKIPKDPYIYAYEGSKDGSPLLYVKNIKRGDTDWIKIDEAKGDRKKFYYAICDMYGHLLGMNCANHGEKTPKYTGPLN